MGYCCIPFFLLHETLSIDSILCMLNKGYYYNLYGKDNSGKTTFMIQLQHYLNCFTCNYAGLYLDAKAYAGTDQLQNVLLEIDRACNRAFGRHFGTCSRFTGLFSLEQALSHMTQQFWNNWKRRLVILVDHMDKINDDSLIRMYNNIRYSDLIFSTNLTLMNLYYR